MWELLGVHYLCPLPGSCTSSPEAGVVNIGIKSGAIYRKIRHLVTRQREGQVKELTGRQMHFQNLFRNIKYFVGFYSFRKHIPKLNQITIQLWRDILLTVYLINARRYYVYHLSWRRNLSSFWKLSIFSFCSIHCSMFFIVFTFDLLFLPSYKNHTCQHYGPERCKSRWGHSQHNHSKSQENFFYYLDSRDY